MSTHYQGPMTGFVLKWIESTSTGAPADVTLYCDGIPLGIGRGADHASALHECWSMLLALGEGNGAVGFVADAFEDVTGVPPQWLQGDPLVGTAYHSPGSVGNKSFANRMLHS